MPRCLKLTCCAGPPAFLPLWGPGASFRALTPAEGAGAPPPCLYALPCRHLKTSSAVRKETRAPCLQPWTACWLALPRAASYAPAPAWGDCSPPWQRPGWRCAGLGPT